MSQPEYPPHIAAELAKFDTEQGAWLEQLKKQNPSLGGKLDEETLGMLNDILAEIMAGKRDSGMLPEFMGINPEACRFEQLPGLPAIAAILGPNNEMVGFTRFDGDPTLVS